MAFGLIGAIASTVVGGIISSNAKEDEAEAFEQQAQGNREIAEKQAAFAREMAEIEARLTEEEGEDAYEIALFNRTVALDNAEWEARAGAVALAQAKKKWEAHLGTATHQLATSGFRLDEAASDVLAEQAAEAQKDFLNVRRTSENQVARQQAQAALFGREGERALDVAAREAAAIRRGGEIDAETARLSGAASARAATIRGRAARDDAFAALLGAGTTALDRVTSDEAVMKKLFGRG